MKTYVIVAQFRGRIGDRKMVWIKANSYDQAKNDFAISYPDYEAVSMWLRVRS